MYSKWPKKRLCKGWKLKRPNPEWKRPKPEMTA